MIYFKRKHQYKNRHDKQLSKHLSENITQVKQTLGNSRDLIFREIQIGERGAISAALIYIEGLAADTKIQDFIMEALMLDGNVDDKTPFHQDPLKSIKDRALTIANVEDCPDVDKLYSSILSGKTIILLDGYSQGLSADTEGWENRGVSEPTQQTVIRGPQDAFTETITINTSLLRRRIQSPNLWVEEKTMGTVTQTDVAVLSIKGIVNDKLMNEVHQRLDNINIDSILEGGYIEELIQDKTYTPFPTIYNTERPDVVAAGLLEGRVAIVVDGTPFVLLVPALFTQFYQASEDYYQRADIATALRFLRVIALFIACLGPSLYIALTTFHIEVLPTPFLVSLASQREGVPFPAFLEALIMEIMFEILREAGIRMPKAVGPAVSIVGSLVIGMAAVEAGLVVPMMVVVVATTAICSFVPPSFNMTNSVRLLRFIIMSFAATLGLYGILICVIAIALHLCSLRSFGIPYMTPMAPFILEDQKDTLLRLPRWGLFARPRLLNQNNIIREESRPPKPESR